MQTKRFIWPVRAKARNSNTVTGEKYRFTVLTPSLIRMEYAENGQFEDRASQSVFYRDFPKCAFSCDCAEGILVLQTETLVLTYQENALFKEDSLSVRLKNEPASCWRYGEDFEDLGGTARTLDCVNGSCPLGRGVVSRNGFSVMDDSHTMLLEEDGWIGIRQENTVDSYFFGYGFSYLQAVQDLYRLTGVPPMLPAYALGNWWSRYHAYTQQEYSELIERFRDEDIPFSVGVVDMDWHIVEIPEQQKVADIGAWGDGQWLRNGWTGYSWNRKLFPDHKGFLKLLKERNLHTALNLHPHAGVRPHEDMYEQMAQRCGVDPKSRKRIPFNILSREFMESYFDVLHHPYEAEGVDFWWMDWQQGTDYWWIHEPNKAGQYQDPKERMDPLWMLNHLHILDISRNGKRPMFFSRYSGPGSQRYPVGFSGDTLVTWDSLQFQPYFTATATNIGYTAWSHDIGGHVPGYQDDDLQVRWLQLGVFSPINRLHSTASEFMRKEPWCYEQPAQDIMKKWLRLRHRLFPYLYTMNYKTHTELLPLIRPMYYSYPKCHCAYEVPNQFWFGSELMVAPITTPQDTTTHTGKVTAWLPRGDWFDFFSGLHYFSKRGRKMELHRSLSTIPALAKAGAIVPLAQYQKHDNRLTNSENMEVVVFPGADNTFTLYEDAGEYSDYQNGAFVKTDMTLKWGENAVFTIHPAKGDLSLIPKRRSWTVSLRGFHKDAAVQANIPGASIARMQDTNTTCVTVTVENTETVVITVSGEQLMHDNGDVMERCRDVVLFSQISNKDRLMEIVRRETSVRQRLIEMYFYGREWSSVTNVLRELLTLTEED